nr:hypothetical protein [Kibdelosporangium sp. MJ126-NF4]CTQ90664.1 hypothetical protein [Kibdelosporangium sp. MJ126-NF4]
MAADPYGRTPEAVADAFAELTAVLTQTGLPQMAASVFACLYATDTGSLTAAELVQRLQVSPASVSKAVSYLETQELIRREHDTAGRRERYIVGGDLWYRSLMATAQRNTALAAGARRTATLLGSDTPAGARLADAAEFLDRIGQEIIQTLQRWWQAHLADSSSTASTDFRSVTQTLG